MALYSPPPPAVPFSEAKPTLLVSWWITTFCTCIVLLRLAGRYIRVEKLFLEDQVCALALVPMYIRMACVHVVLLYGTNNAQLDNLDPASEEAKHRMMGSRMVLASRIFYAATLWTLKLTTLEFLGRLAGASMKKAYLRQIIFLRYALGASFIAVIVSDLAECQPISKYWQVVPDPGPQCRQGFAQLLTTGISSSIIDMVLIAFPVPIVLSTKIATKRKVLLVLLFCFGFTTVAITLFRLPNIISRSGDQVYRSMWASIELFAATIVANLVALGSFLRDSGAKKKKFRRDYGSSNNTSSHRHGTAVTNDWDEGIQTKKQYKDWLDVDHTTEFVGPKDVESNSQTSSPETQDNRGHSPTESQHSLLRHSLSKPISASRVPGTVDRAHPTSPDAVLVAGRSTVRRR